MDVGVLALQGDVREHVEAARRAAEELNVDVDVEAVRTAEGVRGADVVVLPGGESTTLSRLAHETDVAEALVDHVTSGGRTLATCAGLILVSRSADDDRVETLGLLDVAVERNAYGGQRESFEADVEVEGVDGGFHAVFIRAPRIAEVGEAEPIAWLDDDVVGVRGGPEGNVVATSFHPELTDDVSVHGMVMA
ncbi:MAG: pyridoxal 5'-phosphate synthase glutaminase subunit PdxT [Halobacteriales archaeon]